MLPSNHMGMLTKEDLSQIGQLFDQKFDHKFAMVKTELIEALGEVIEQNINPQFDELRSEMKDGFDRLDRRLDRADGKVNALVNVLERRAVITPAEKRVVLS